MRPLHVSFPALAAALLAVPAQNAPPAGATGLCKDGTYTTSASRSGACHGHQGVKEWLAAASATPATPLTPATPKTPATPAATKTPATPVTPAVPVTPAAPVTPKAPTHASTATMPQAPGGGPGMVWLNSDSSVYHCPSSQYYGKTRQGSYMSEADAKAKGAHADHNHPCTK
jgi:Protein of unknown function (DUF3761)